MKFPPGVPPTPRVTIVIVNWNKRQHVIKLLDSLRHIAYVNHQIVVVDNASTDGSVQAIKKHPLPIILLENCDNLGGTGGFNTGLRYAVSGLSQKYIWMLDNDAEVLPETLSELVRVLEEDTSVGIAGSCIMSPEDHDLIVEAGAFVGWGTGTSIPHLRYHRADSYRGERIIEVDSVAACSALVRDAVVREIGVMDDRFFLHWDDIDYCVRIKQAGHRVVAAMDAPVYHVAEKGYSPATSYYNFRNVLLFQAKHQSSVKVFFAGRAIAASYLTLAWYLRLLGHRAAARYVKTALQDFLGGRFGKASVPSASLATSSPMTGEETRALAKRWRSVLVFGVGAFEEVQMTVQTLKELCPHLSITVAVTADRSAVYRLPQVDRLITFHIFTSGLLAKLNTAGTVLSGGFDCGITSGPPLLMPYAFLLPENIYFSCHDKAFHRSAESSRSLWKVPLSILAGQASALAFAIHLLLARREFQKELTTNIRT